MTRIVELFGQPTNLAPADGWGPILADQPCPYLNRKCTKIRKSQPDIAIGTCSVRHGRLKERIVICPNRLLEQGQVFTDCIHLLSLHEPGNQLHLVPEIGVPGGSVDYFLVSVRAGQVKDFVGVELQTLDTTGTVWPERQRFLQSAGIEVDTVDASSQRPFGMNWKMTAKTTLVQLHHKSESFEVLNKHLVIVVQDQLLAYLRREFQFDHLNRARLGDPVHLHSYKFPETADVKGLNLDERLSTDSEGIGHSLGLKADAKVEIAEITRQIEEKIAEHTLFIPHR